jgi:hypothetical protein
MSGWFFSALDTVEILRLSWVEIFFKVAVCPMVLRVKLGNILSTENISANVCRQNPAKILAGSVQNTHKSA